MKMEQPAYKHLTYKLITITLKSMVAIINNLQMFDANS